MDSKYKMFRNFMYNELNITKEDIKEWTKEAVKEVAQDRLRQINIEGIVWDQINSWRKKSDLNGLIAKGIAESIAKKMDIKIKD